MNARRLIRGWPFAALLVLVASTARGEVPVPEETTVVLTAAEQADFATVKAFLVASLHASDARLRTFVGVDLQTAMAEFPEAQRVSVDTLAEQARGSTDPMVLAILSSACDLGTKPKPHCDVVSLARQWTVADTQNQVAWLTLASALRFAGDAQGARSAFVRGAFASTWHEAYDDGSRMVTAALPKTLGPRSRMALQMLALTGSGAFLLPNAAVGELSFRCKDPTLGDACRRILDTIDRDDGSTFGKSVAARLSRGAGFDPETVERRMRLVDDLQYASSQAGWKDWQEVTDPAELETQAALLDRRIALGEIAHAKTVLDAGGPALRTATARVHVERTAARERAEADERRRNALR